MSGLSPGSHGGAFRTQHGIVVGRAAQAAAAMRARGMSEAQIRRNLGLRGVAPGRAGNSFAGGHPAATPTLDARPGNAAARLEKEIAPARKGRKPRPAAQDIIEACAAAGGVTAADLLNKSRQRAVVRPRQLAALLIRRADPAIHWVAMGDLFGQDHTTVLYAVRMAETRLDLGDAVFTALHDRAVEILEGGA